jgi:hypothetical protein
MSWSTSSVIAAALPARARGESTARLVERDPVPVANFVHCLSRYDEARESTAIFGRRLRRCHQRFAALCSIWCVAPPTVIDPDRSCEPVLRPTWYASSPLPVPARAEEITIHSALLDALHSHPDCVLTRALPSPPSALKDR